MEEITRRSFLKGLGIVATSLTIPVSLELVTKPFIEIGKAHRNFLILQASQKLVVAEIKAIDLDMAERHRILPVVFQDTFDYRQIASFNSTPSRLELELYNGVPMRFEGTGRIFSMYRSKDGNCIDISLDQFRCLTDRFIET